ncbi:MAG: 4Fe-4S dicluster domain-containing protein [Negativicutes bacterium]|nr:4Fe-4S dicluster domain-containing protein [Negativicutes bacterium]
MRGLESSVTKIRKQVFAEVARLAYEGGDYSRVEQLPYVIVPGETAKYRESIFLERAIAGERIRLAMGLPIRPVSEHKLLSEGVDQSAIAEKYYEPPLVNIIPFACNACPTTQYRVTEFCQGCLAKSCAQVCPSQAIIFEHLKAVVDQQKCIKCGRCSSACSYNAVIRLERPCAAACGVDAIGMDEHGKAKIDYNKCVSCGMCLVNCPFGAIVDKGQIFQLVLSIQRGDQVIAIVAPAFLGQFGAEATPERLTAAMQQLGFDRVVEVAVGADLCTVQEAELFLREVPAEKPFLATSCCPSWSMMAKQLFPQFADCISMALTPMVLTARLLKKKYPRARIAFIGPCSAKKLEASRSDIRSDVDFVLTFEELQGMFVAKEVQFAQITAEIPLNQATAAGRGFAVTGGVSGAVVDVIKKLQPERQIKVTTAEGLRNCKKMLTAAKSSVYNGYLLEGMACPGGCIAGAGTIQPIGKAREEVTNYKNAAQEKNALNSKYVVNLPELEE